MDVRSVDVRSVDAHFGVLWMHWFCSLSALVLLAFKRLHKFMLMIGDAGMFKMISLHSHTFWTERDRRTVANMQGFGLERDEPLSKTMEFCVSLQKIDHYGS